MYLKTDGVVQGILHDLERHPDFSFLIDIASAVSELSHEWNPTLHFTAREADADLPVVIKVGVAEAEMYWTKHLSSAAPDLFPKLFTVGHLPAQADGEEPGFIVSERIPCTLIGPTWEGK